MVTSLSFSLQSGAATLSSWTNFAFLILEQVQAKIEKARVRGSRNTALLSLVRVYILEDRQKNPDLHSVVE